MSVTTFDLIRHGEPVGGRKYRGQIDDPLSDKGWQQMRDAVGAHHPWDQIMTSPLTRCAAFADEVAKRHSIALESDARLKEIGFGDWEGRTAQQIQTEQPGLLEAFWTDPVKNRPPGAEPLVDFQQRIVSAWDDLLAQYAGQHILVVCHAGVIRMTMLHALGMPIDHIFRIQVANASITRIQVDRHEAQFFPRLIFHGGTL